MDPRLVLIAAAVAGLYYMGHKTVSGIKHIDQKIVAKIHHHKTAPKPMDK